MIAPSEVEVALGVARALAAAGIPIFVAYPDPENPGDFKPPREWQNTKPNPSYVDAWRPGLALCAVMGQGLDLIDIDPRHGGDRSALVGLLPTVHGEATTPSDGAHLFPKSLGVRSRDSFLPGIDLKAGDPQGAGRGFAFIAPTVRKSKTTGEMVPYRWTRPPDVVRLTEDGDDTGRPLADFIQHLRAPRTGVGVVAAGRISTGARNSTLASLAGTMRRRGMTQGAVEAALLVQNEQCVPPLEESEIRGIAASVSRYPSEVQPPDSDHDGDVEREVHRLHVRDAAQRQVRAEQRGTSAPPQGHVLAEWQRSDDAPLTYRIEGWQPADSRVLLVAQFKAGKTTVVGNLIRSLVDGDPFLGTAAVVPVEGTVALIDTEMSERQLKYWLRDQQIAHPDRVVVYPLRGRVETLDIRDEDVRREWVERLRAARVAYLVIDCFRPILDALGLDENHDAGRVLVAIDALLQDAGIRDCLVVHHMGHTGERSRGDSRLRDWPDVEWRLVRQADDPASPRFLSAFGRDVDVPESAITYDELSRRLTLAGGSRADAAAEAALGAVLEVLTAPLSGRGIEKALADSDHKRPAIRRAITLGQKRGVLRARPRSGRGGGTEYAKCAGDPNCATSAPAQKRRCASAPIEGALLNTDQGEEVSRVTYIGFDPAERWAVT